MADPKAQQQETSAIGATDVSDFDSLLKKEFKPQDRRSQRGGRTRRPHARRAGALADKAHRRRRRQVDRGDHRAARQEAHRADQPDPAPRGLPEARRRLARPAPSRQQHRNGRNAQDPFHEHQQGRAREDAQAVQGHRLGSEPAVQEDLRGRVRTVRRRALRLPGRRLLFRPHAARRRAAGRDGAGRGRRAHAVHLPRRRRRSCRCRRGRNWPTRAT